MDGKINFQSGQTSGQGDTRQVNQAGQQSAQKPTQKSTKTGLLAMIRGISNQIVVQLRLATEFGIPYAQLFTEDFRGLNRGEIERVIINWLRAGDDGVAAITTLSNDLLAHQIAVLSGLDGIVKQTLESLDPEQLGKNKGLLSGKGKSWQAYTEVFQDLSENIVKRHQQIVVPGFTTAYVKARDNQSRHPVEISEFDK